ncbi:phage head-tail joining protein [Marinobacterium litorale]|uniref:phage head-tail joining protein n=1 Tax=Marinobacterium litorale TaxID=404770 RepID=UPI0003FF6B39|nr:hypothetical protein [Marinobacterium litorale]
MAFTQDDLDSIREAIASGEKSVTYADGKSVTYRSMAELHAAEARIEKALAAAENRRPRRGVRVNVSKGL